ncbi:MAG TPA: sn-glycerol-3-phosphate ABC transporter ATP-binding protein UgpC [Gammaproteobacteria bacterium]|nr:sn-glycerol-3-phosphate ABC transporter ATP-binding protein UgpC [Gammaproteobacteria bacterium]
MAKVELKALRKSFGPIETIHGVDLTIEDGEFCVFVGPSGCGKSTLLRIVAGLEDITAGDLSIGGRRVNDVPPAGRGVAMVFQSYALYPHMNVYNNMAFGLKIPGGDANAVQERVEDAARMLKLDQLLQRLPKQLSGGQRQRVAIGRAIVRKPEVFLFDEPLSNLDAALRIQMRMEIARLHNQLGNTMIYVTHDQVEAMTLADKIVVLNDGNVEQVGAPLDLYHYPRNVFVATFIGAPQMNLMSAEVVSADARSARVRLQDGSEVNVEVDGSHVSAGDNVRLGVRPEDFCETDASVQGVSGEVLAVEPLGEATLIHLRFPGATNDTLIGRFEGAVEAKVGDTVTLRFQPRTGHLFDGDGKALQRHFQYREEAA